MNQAYLKIWSENMRIVSLEEIMTIGKDDSCQVRLHGADISDRHARLERKDSGYLVRDLRSQEGTYLNEARVMEAFLQEGDILRIGDVEMTFMTSLPVSNEFPMKSRNPVWHQELQALNNVAGTSFPVLILGPSGTGKDLIAEALHEQSLRRQGPFVSVNCSALSETLIESELFGHIKGSFTGAISDRKGAFESARGGTLFLDEIGDLSYSLQAKLLRAIENGEIRPVGADRNVKTDVRVLAATHQNLSEKIQDGSFRSDLYFRLNVVSIAPPALNLRMEDFDDLIYTFAKTQKVRFSFNAIARLKKHPWPGNIRELKNLVSRAAALYPRQQIEEAHVEKLIDKSLLDPRDQPKPLQAHSPVIREIEKQMIIKRLMVNKGNQRRTAHDLGMPKSTLHDRLKYYDIDPTQFKV